MAIGTALAIGLGLAGASAGAQIYGAKKAAGTAREAGQIQSDAANRAAEMQLQASREGLDFLREEAAFNRQSQAPYRAIGTGAINTLSNLTGVPMVNQVPGPGAAPPSGMTLGSVGEDQTQAGLPTTGQVLLRAPNGRVRSVPANQAAHYISRGAMRVQ